MKALKYILPAIALGTGLFLFSAFKSSIPKGVKAVKPFDMKKYLGRWYEMARFDYKWERNLDNVTATYSLREDGKIKVDNRGYNYKKEKWEESIGKAKPAGEADEGMLKVSFFGPFYAGYNVIALDKDYKYAMVAGDSKDYLWILSREKYIPEDVRKDYLIQAKALGFETEKLIWVKHDKD